VSARTQPCIDAFLLPVTAAPEKGPVPQDRAQLTPAGLSIAGPMPATTTRPDGQVWPADSPGNQAECTRQRAIREAGPPARAGQCRRTRSTRAGRSRVWLLITESELRATSNSDRPQEKQPQEGIYSQQPAIRSA